MFKVSRWRWFSMKTIFFWIFATLLTKNPIDYNYYSMFNLYNFKKKEENTRIVDHQFTTISIWKNLALGFFNVQFYFFVVTRNCICSSLSQKPPSQHLWKWRGIVRFFLQKFQIFNVWIDKIEECTNFD